MDLLLEQSVVSGELGTSTSIETEFHITCTSIAPLLSDGTPPHKLPV